MSQILTHKSDRFAENIALHMHSDRLLTLDMFLYPPTTQTKSSRQRSVWELGHERKKNANFLYFYIIITGLDKHHPRVYPPLTLVTVTDEEIMSSERENGW